MKKVNKVLLCIGIIATIIGISPCWAASGDSSLHLNPDPEKISSLNNFLTKPWRNKDGVIHWYDKKDGLIHWIQNGNEHWRTKDGLEHWHGVDGEDCWLDKDGKEHTQAKLQDNLQNDDKILDRWIDQYGNEHHLEKILSSWDDDNGLKHQIEKVQVVGGCGYTREVWFDKMGQKHWHGVDGEDCWLDKDGKEHIG